MNAKLMIAVLGLAVAANLMLTAQALWFPRLQDEVRDFLADPFVDKVVELCKEQSYPFDTTTIQRTYRTIFRTLFSSPSLLSKAVQDHKDYEAGVNSKVNLFELRRQQTKLICETIQSLIPKE